MICFRECFSSITHDRKRSFICSIDIESSWNTSNITHEGLPFTEIVSSPNAILSLWELFCAYMMYSKSLHFPVSCPTSSRIDRSPYLRLTPLSPLLSSRAPYRRLELRHLHRPLHFLLLGLLHHLRLRAQMRVLCCLLQSTETYVNTDYLR